MNSANKVCTRSSYNLSKAKTSPAINDSPDDAHTCGKGKVSVKKAANSSAKRPQKVLKKNNAKKNPSSLKMITKPVEENCDMAVTESTASLPNVDSTDGSVQDQPKPVTRASKQKKIISKTLFSTDSSSIDSSVPNSPILKKASEKSPKRPTKRRISSSDSQENLRITISSPLSSKGTKSPSSKKKVCFSDNYDNGVVSGTVTEYNLPCSSVSVSNFAESSPKRPIKRRKLIISCEQQSTSSESEMNSNKEFFVISDSELNYMNSDQELNMQFIASSEEEGTSSTNPNTEMNTSARESKLICVYKDHQVKSLEDVESHSVLINQTKMLAALKYYHSDKNFSAEQSPTKSRGPTLNEIHPDLFLSPPSAEVVSNLQLFTKEDNGNDSTLELSPKMLGYGNDDHKEVPMSMNDSRLLPDVSLCYDPNMEELGQSSQMEISPSKSSPSPKKRIKRTRGKKKGNRYKKKAASSNSNSLKDESSEVHSSQEQAQISDLDGNSVNIKDKSPELQFSQERAKVTESDCESNNNEVAVADSKLPENDVLRSVIDTGSHEPNNVSDNNETFQSRITERKGSDDADKLAIFTDDENLDFEPDSDYPSYSHQKSPEYSEPVEAYSQSTKFLSTDCSNNADMDNAQSSSKSYQSSLEDGTAEESPGETQVSDDCDKIPDSENHVVECNGERNEEECEETNFTNSANDSNKPPETDFETELEEEEAWSASEMNSQGESSCESNPSQNISTLDNSYFKAPLLNTEQNSRSIRRDSDSDGDSDSDTDHSFKRREQQNSSTENNLNERKGFNSNKKESNQERCDGLSSTSTSMDKSYDSPVEGLNFIPQSPPYPASHIRNNLNHTSADKKTNNEEVRNAEGVFKKIIHLCEKCDIKGAIEVSKRFISISPSEMRERIFQEIFWAVMGYITHPACPEPNSQAAELASCVLDVLYEYDLHSPQMCSMIVCKSLLHPISVPHALDVLQICQKLCIPLSEAAIVAYISHLMSMETSVETYLTFLEYVKKCGKFKLPKTVLHKALGLFLADQESQSLPLFKRICDLLCGIEASQVEENLQSFMACCIRNDCWLEIVKCFKAWSRISSSCHILSQALAFPLPSAGIHYAKFAAALHDGVDSLPLNLTHLFGQIGVMLMLEAYSKEEIKTALEVLHTMHTFKINYCELQVPLYTMDYIDSLVKVVPESTEPVFSFTVAFAAVDVFMQTAKPKTAFTVLQGFTKTLPANLNEILRSKITPQLYKYFMKLSQILHQIDPLYKGLEALNAFLSALESYVNQELKGVTISNMNDLRTVYLQNSVSLLNAERVREAFDLFHRCASIFQDDLKPQKFVVRGLLTAASLHRMKEEARNMYLFGCKKKIYTPAKLDFELQSWNLLVESCWTRSEIKFVLATFLEDISRFYILHKRKLMNQNLYTLRIQFKPDPKEFSPELKCLKVSSTFDAALERVGLELRITDPNLSWSVDSTAKAILIDPNSLYDFWKNKFSEPKHDSSPGFLIKGNHRYSFGSDISDLSPPHPDSNVTSPVRVSLPAAAQTSQTVSPSVTARRSHSISPNRHPPGNSPTVTKQPPQSVSPMVTVRQSGSGSSPVINKHPHNPSPTKKADTVNHQPSPTKNPVTRNHPLRVSPTKKAASVNHPLSPTKKAVARNHPPRISPTKKAVTLKASQVAGGSPVSKPVRTAAIAKPPQSSAVTSKASQIAGGSPVSKTLSTAAVAKPPQSTASTSQPLLHVRPTCTAPVNQRHQKAQILPPMQSGPVLVNEEFQKVVSFVKARVFLKCKHLSPQDREIKAVNLAQAFINEHNITTKLDKKSMKLLNDYTEKNIHL